MGSTFRTTKDSEQPAQKSNSCPLPLSERGPNKPRSMEGNILFAGWLRERESERQRETRNKNDQWLMPLQRCEIWRRQAWASRRFWLIHRGSICMELVNQFGLPLMSGTPTGPASIFPVKHLSYRCKGVPCRCLSFAIKMPKLTGTFENLRAGGRFLDALRLPFDEKSILYFCGDIKSFLMIPCVLPTMASPLATISGYLPMTSKCSE